MSEDALTERLAAARTRLLLDKPFLGALVLRLPLKPAGAWCATSATDARALYYNPGWVQRLSAAQLQFALAHEALHCALGHFARRGHRVPARWDLACDLAINPLLLDDGLAPPPEASVLTLYRGLSAEEIYASLDAQDDDTPPMDEHAWDEPPPQGTGSATREPDDSDGLGRPPPLTPQERDALRQQWQRHLAAAAQRAREAGRLPAGWARLAGTALAPQVPWRAALAQLLMQTARDDHSWSRPSRREGEALLPSLRSRSGALVVAIDSSGSVSDSDLAAFVAELDALKATLSARTTLLACDSTLAADGPWVSEPWEPLQLPRRFQGGGGTDFRPVFDWVDQQGLRPDALVYFTDALGPFPAQPPDYPVLWLVKGRAAVPWGRRIALN